MGLLYASPILLILLCIQLFPRPRKAPSNAPAVASFSSPFGPLPQGSSILHIDRAETVNNYQGVGILTPTQRSEFVALVKSRLQEK